MNKGVSRTSRINKALSPESIQIDERSMMDMVNSTLDYAESVNYFNFRDTHDGNWKSFFLKDPIFIMAIIAGADIKIFKIKQDRILNENPGNHNPKASVSKPDNFRELQKVVRLWNNLLSDSDYNGELVDEVEKLDESINEEVRLEESIHINSNIGKNIQDYSREFNNIYAKILHFKEEIGRKFRDEIIFEYSHLPHIGLILTFYKLFQFVQLDINKLTKKHLDYYYRDLLQENQNPQNSQSHTTMIACELKKEVKNLIIDKGAVFNFDLGEGLNGDFLTTRTAQINKATIADVKTILKKKYKPFESRDGLDAFYYEMLFETDILNRIDSLKEYQLNSLEDFPMTFGEENQHYCDIGFIVSSPSLLLEEGNQVIDLEFKLENNPFADRDANDKKTKFSRLIDKEFELFMEKREEANRLKAEKGLLIEKLSVKDKEIEREKLTKIIEKKFFEQAFNIFITNSDGWKRITYKRQFTEDDQLDLIKISIPLIDIDDQLVSFNPAVHEGDYKTEWPCIKILLNNEATYHPYTILKEITIEYILVRAIVRDVSKLKLSNSNGEVDHTIPFPPFGSIPKKGSFLRIQNPLIFQKSLTSLDLSIQWNGLPLSKGGFTDYYREYFSDIKTESFKAFITHTLDLDRTNELKHLEFDLFRSDNLDYLKAGVDIEVSLGDIEYDNTIIQMDGVIVKNKTSLYLVLKNPEIAFGHNVFPQIYAKAAMQNARFFKKSVPLPNQPYTPLIDQLTVNYTNTLKENVLRKENEDTAILKLIHIHPFGQDLVFPGSVRSPFYLLPQINDKGNLFIGLQNVRPNEIVSIGLELIPAVNFNTVVSKPKIYWKYLNNNKWVDFMDNVLEDGTNGFIKSGIIKLEIPSAFQMDNTLLAAGKFWVKAEYNDDEDLNSRIKKIFTQAIALSSEMTLPKNLFSENSIKKPVKITTTTGNKKIENIKGPFDFETVDSSMDDTEFYALVSEQLRHKKRGITNWDIERIILEKFPMVDKVRVFGRSNFPKELVQGSTTQIVVIPHSNYDDISLYERNKFDIGTLLEIKKCIKDFVSPFAHIEVCNPVFEKLKVRCRIQFVNDLNSPMLKIKLNEDLIGFLSPRAWDSDSDSLFEKSFTKSEIYNFINEKPYVKKILKFSVIQLIHVNNKYRIIDTEDNIDFKNTTRWELRTISAYAILTSASLHHIEIWRSQDEKDEIKGIGDIAIGSDFIISEEIDGRNIYIEV